MVVTRSSGPNGAVEFELSVEVDYNRRSLAPREQNAVSLIFDRCCKNENDCIPWTRDIKRKAVEVCHLKGSVCDNSGHLLRLWLPGFGLKCTFPLQAFSALSRLEKLELGSNSISGDISIIMDELRSSRSRIEHLGLSNNNLVGAVLRRTGSQTSSNSCATVQAPMSVLDLRNNRVSGSLPACLFSPESSLSELLLSRNPLNGSTLPEGFSSGSKVRVLDLSGTGINGTIPGSLGEAALLQVLDLSGNALTGTVPGNLGQLPALEFVNLAGNRLKGRVPSSLAKARSLKVLWMSGNLFTKLPSEWGGDGSASQTLVDVVLADNQIGGRFPVALARAKNILRLDVGGNFLQGQLPNEVGLFPRAVSVDLANNAFSGNFPHQWSDLGMFRYLTGGGAKTIIRRDTNEPVISTLDFSNNNISGLIPRTLAEAHSSRLVKVILSGNADLMCPYIVGRTCEQYFVSVSDADPRVAEAGRVDTLYVEAERDVDDDAPQRQLPRAPVGAPPSSSRSDHPIGLITAVIVAGAVLGAAVAVLVARGMRTRRANRQVSWGATLLTSTQSEVSGKPPPTKASELRSVDVVPVARAGAPSPPLRLHSSGSQSSAHCLLVSSGSGGTVSLNSGGPIVSTRTRAPSPSLGFDGMLPQQAPALVPPSVNGRATRSIAREKMESVLAADAEEALARARSPSPVLTEGSATRAGCMAPPLRTGISDFALGGGDVLPRIRVKAPSKPDRSASTPSEGADKTLPSLGGEETAPPPSADPAALSSNQDPAPSPTSAVSSGEFPPPRSGPRLPQSSVGGSSSTSTSPATKVGSPSLNTWLPVAHARTATGSSLSISTTEEASPTSQADHNSTLVGIKE